MTKPTPQEGGRRVVEESSDMSDNTLAVLMTVVILSAFLFSLTGCTSNPDKYCTKWGQYGKCSQWEYVR